MLTKYIEAAMKKAHYEIIEDDGTFWGEILGFQGVWGNAKTLEDCRQELEDVLGGWLILKLWGNDDDIPVVGKISLTPKWKRTRKTHEAADAPRNRKAS